VRVTDKMIFEGAKQRTGKARDDAEAASREVSTGVRVQHPWDDPAAAAAVVGHRSSAARAQAIADIAGRASSELDAADQALGGMNDVLARARELVVQFSNDTYSAAERATAANEITGLLTQTRQFANTKFGGRYLFAGFKDDTEPFDANGGYSGDSGVRKAEVAPGQFENASIRGDEVFKGAGGGVDIFATLTAVRTALAANDGIGIRASLNGVEGSIDQVVQGRARAGSGVNVFDTAVTASEAVRDADNSAAAQRTDADVFTSASRLALAQRALDASLTASAKSFDLTLLSKLGR
jgi:flagellar hook-associated protein 3 FlgL